MPEPIKHVGSLEPNVRKMRLDCQRLVIGGKRLAVTPESAEDVAYAFPGARVGRLDGDCSLIGDQRLIVTSQLEQGLAAIEMRHREVRLKCHHPVDALQRRVRLSSP